MVTLQTILNVRGESSLEKAIAQEIHGLDDKDLKENLLQELSIDYGPKKHQTHTIIEDGLDNGGQDFNTANTQ